MMSVARGWKTHIERDVRHDYIDIGDIKDDYVVANNRQEHVLSTT